MLLATPLSPAALRGLGRHAQRAGVPCHDAPRWAADRICRYLTVGERQLVRLGWDAERGGK